MVEETSAPDPHRPIMVAEVVEHLRPRPGDLIVDCTLGGGGHARALLPHVQPGGRLIGLDVDPVELPRAEARLLASGFDPATFALHHANFRDVRDVLARHGVSGADAMLVDLGVSSMQHDTPERGFSYKHPGPLDLRMDPTAGVPAWQQLAALDQRALADLLTANADEPHAVLIAGLLARERPRTTHALERLVRMGLSTARPELPKAEVKMSVRRTFQAIRILVNDEFAALDA
jgi:16S rRNA (cytosine1402-N4)-methyltransferase